MTAPWKRTAVPSLGADSAYEHRSVERPVPSGVSVRDDTPGTLVAEQAYEHRLNNAQARAAEAAADWCWNATPESEQALRDAVAEWRTALGLWRLSTRGAVS